MEEYINYNSMVTDPRLKGQALFVTDSASTFAEKGSVLPQAIGNIKFMPWGEENDRPYKIMEFIDDDETLSTCQAFNAEICYGAGLRYNVESCTSQITDKVDAFLVSNNLPSYYFGACQDMKHFGFVVTVIIFNKERSEIVKILRKEACYCRFSEANAKGKIDFVYYANWKNNPKEKEIETIPLLDVNSPYLDLLARLENPKSVTKFAILTKVPTPDNTYYPEPYYVSLFKGKWYNIKKLIGIAKEAKLKNSAPIKYQIDISEKYWERIFRMEHITDKKEKEERVDKEKQQIMDFLTGAENAGKVWFTTFYQLPTGEVQKDVVITKIDDSKEGGDWSTDIQEAINMFCFTMRVHSNLVGSVPGKSQSNNSGSDKRELYTIAQALQKPYHDLLFQVHRLIMRVNKWQGAFPECPFIQLTTLDENKDAKLVNPQN